MTPHGVAGIRGTDFGVEAIPTQDGKFLVTFSSITGVITVSAVIDGVTVTHTLTTGTSWEIGQNPREMRREIIQDYQSQIMNMVQSIENIINGLPPGGPGPGPGRGNPNPPPPNTPPPFQGGPPGGGSAS
jgi:hypothetical protein